MRVVIGAEHAESGMQDWSMVIARYGETDASGAVAVIGPTRMAYQRTIPRVRYVASRSEEHTSELQSLMRISYAVFCLKKKQKETNNSTCRDLENKRTTN